MWIKVKKYMKINGLNQEQLAKKMKVHSGVISDLKLGRIKKPSFELACKFADALGIKVDELR
ncbi:helix-turn-helix domain-containing protein [Enterococcus hermanniensis]|nr:helix-turn-helix transcriptional regulator [Enterococcus hermanniensis]